MVDQSTFPTLADAADRLRELVDKGLGALPVQVLVVPDATLQAIALDGGHPIFAKPALMIDLVPDAANGRQPFGLISTERLSAGGGMPTTRMQ